MATFFAVLFRPCSSISRPGGSLKAEAPDHHLQRHPDAHGHSSSHGTMPQDTVFLSAFLYFTQNTQPYVTCPGLTPRYGRLSSVDPHSKNPRHSWLCLWFSSTPPWQGQIQPKPEGHFCDPISERALGRSIKLLTQNPILDKMAGC